MRKRYITLLIGVFYASIGQAQPVDLVLNSPESGTIVHKATNSITFSPGYAYTPAGGTMLAEIVNSGLIDTTTYITEIDPATRSLNTSDLVGTIDGSFSVNPVGAATYQIPIDVLPGTSGLQPSLSLSYNSLGGPGVVGYGWNISGISVVTRSPKSYYYDGEASGIDLSNNDRFSLDGQRLVCISGAYGGNGSLYRTENDNFTRVNGYTNTYGASKFLAETRNGLDYQYGYTSNASQTIDGHNEIVNWYVNSIADVYGNQINYTYIKDKGSVYISQITYGPNTISFSYKQRYDKSVQYFEGSKIEQNLILDKIEVKYNANVIRTYKFKYNYSGSAYNQYSLLNEIVEYGTGGSQYNSTVFSYEAPGNVAISQTKYNTTQNDINYKSHLYFGDFNGDGIKDVFCLPDESRGGTLSDGWKMYLGDGKDNFTFSAVGTLSDPTVCEQVADLNGDGKDDVVIAWFTTYGNITTKHYQCWISNGTTFEPSSIFAGSVAGVSYASIFFAYAYGSKSADFDGDGLADFVLYTTSDGNWELYSYSNGNGGLANDITKQANGSISGGLPGNVYYGDFNGDGLTELLNVTSDSLRVFSYKAGSFRRIYGTSNLKSSDHFHFGDFNGDGKIDVLKYGDASGDMTTWSMMLGTGAGFDFKSIVQKKSNLKDDRVDVGDFNGDGRTDLMISPSANGSWTGRYYYISNNSGDDFTVINTITVYPYPTWDYYLYDLNGDGCTDYLCTAGTYTWTGYQIYKSTDSNTGTGILLNSLANGVNQRSEIFYRRLSQEGAPYTKGTGAEFPVYDFQGALPVVTSVVADNGVGSRDTMNYLYEGAKIHRQGKGFLCYAKTTVTDAATQKVREDNYDYNTSYYFPRLTSSVTTVGSNTVSTTSNIWSFVTTATGINGHNVIFPYISTSTQTDNLTGHSVDIISTYDTYGNQTSLQKSFNNGVTETTVNIFDNNTTNWWLGMLTNSTVTYAKSGDSTITRTVGYSYFTDGILKPDWVNYYSGTSQHRSVNNDYDGHGNLIQAVEATDDGGLKQTNYTYDDDGIRTKTTTGPLGHTTTYNYDTYGRLSSEVDYLNNTTSYTYDGFGRIATQTNPDGFITTTSHTWGLSGGPANACYFVEQSGNDGSDAKTWYDKLNREIRQDVKGFDGSDIYRVTEYNKKGQVYRTSEPSASATPSQWNTNTYDDYGRVTAIDRPSGQNTTYEYTDNKVEVTTGGRTGWKTTDSQGLVTQAHDDGGDIVYAYYPDGKVKTITTPDGAVTSMEYDVAGNQKKLVDPSAGTINYTYNGFGDLKTQTNAESQTATYNYYADGRLDTKVTPEGTTTYTYNDNKQLAGITSPDNVSRTYGYDGKGRVNTITETIPGTTALTTSFTYDNLGRLSTRTHPSGIVETNTYNSAGYLASVAAGGATRYTITEMNARQQVTAATYGSGLNATFDFDTYGYPQASKAQANSVYVQDYRYSFDPVTGDLNFRDNYLRSLHESFSYDNLDRLTGVSGPSNLTMDYNLNGNINTKSDVGTDPFVYNIQGKPYALAEVTSSSGIIPTDSLTATYTSFEQVSTLDQGNYHAAFTYNSDDQRCKMEISDTGSAILTRWYAGSRYMKESDGTSTKQYTWIGGDAYTAPAVAVTDGGTTTWYYLIHDYLGNVTQVVDETNAVTAEYNYDPWGRRRDKDDWSYTLSNEPDLFAGRGFTGHEHLPWFNVINMNGRLYDPVVGRFLSVDNNVSFTGFTQSFNRYSYALNNPLRYTDPDGENPLIILAAIVSAWAGMGQAMVSSDKEGWGLIGDMAKGLFIGAAAGTGGAWAGGAVASSIGIGGFLGGAASGVSGGFVGGFIGGSGNAWLSGADFSTGLMSGFNMGITSGLVGGGIGGLVGGFSSMGQDGNFWTGGYRTGPALAGLDGGGEVYGPFSIRQVDVFGNARLGISAVRNLSILYGLPTTMNFNGFWGRAKYFWTGGNINGGHYDWNGNLTGYAPVTGVAPSPGFAGKGMRGYEYVKKVGRFYKYLKIRKAVNLPGQARAEYVKYFNSDGKLLRMYKDSYRIDGNFLHRRMLKPNENFYRY